MARIDNRNKQNPKLLQAELSDGCASLYLEYYLGRSETPVLDEDGQQELYTDGAMKGRPKFKVKHARKRENLNCRRIAQSSLGSPMSELSRFSVELLRSYVILYFKCDRLSRRLYFQIRHKDSDFRRIMGYVSRCFGGIRRNAACN